MIPLVIASVLKPVDEPRMFERMALSLAKTDKYKVSIIGFKSKANIKHSKIDLYPIFDFNRISFYRIIAPISFFLNVITIRPKILIINTHELLLAGIIYKLIYRSKLIYDVREDYFSNIKSGTSFPLLLKPFVAWYTRFIERFASSFINHYLLAEESYLKIFGQYKHVTIIKNKYGKPLVEFSKKEMTQSLKLLYTGTISSDYGIFDAINFCKDLKIKKAELELGIYGHCSNRKELAKLKEAIEPFQWITLIGGEYHCPHQEIIEAIKSFDFALMPYKKKKYITECFPTKIYECLAYKLPMIITDDPKWVEYCNKYQSCIPINFQSYKIDEIEAAMSNNFYINAPGKEILWENEEPEFLKAIASC